jgi:hypothetical protein
VENNNRYLQRQADVKLKETAFNRQNLRTSIFLMLTSNLSLQPSRPAMQGICGRGSCGSKFICRTAME